MQSSMVTTEDARLDPALWRQMHPSAVPRSCRPPLFACCVGLGSYRHQARVLVHACCPSMKRSDCACWSRPWSLHSSNGQVQIVPPVESIVRQKLQPIGLQGMAALLPIWGWRPVQLRACTCCEQHRQCSDGYATELKQAQWETQCRLAPLQAGKRW